MSTNNLSKQSIGQNKVRSLAHPEISQQQHQYQHLQQHSQHSSNDTADELDHSNYDDTRDFADERSRRVKVSLDLYVKIDRFLQIQVLT